MIGHRISAGAMWLACTLGIPALQTAVGGQSPAGTRALSSMVAPNPPAGRMTGTVPRLVLFSGTLTNPVGRPLLHPARILFPLATL